MSLSFPRVASPADVFPVAGAFLFIEHDLVTPEVEAWADDVSDHECVVFYVRGDPIAFLRQFQWSRTGSAYIGSNPKTLGALMQLFPWITYYHC
jgi:hypothetical protein